MDWTNINKSNKSNYDKPKSDGHESHESQGKSLVLLHHSSCYKKTLSK